MKSFKTPKPVFRSTFSLGLLMFLSVFCIVSCTKREKTVLVYSKTMGFRHGVIESATTAIEKLGKENGFVVIATEDPRYFVEDSLQNYASVVFLNTTKDVLNDVQQAGGGFVGIHAATDTEYDWPWYTKLVGAMFDDHSKIQEAELQVVDPGHPSTKHLDPVWVRSDEWYNFKQIYPDINVLIKIDETSYEGGTNGENHPISWYHEYDGGKSFYTEMGHTQETFEDASFLQHLLGGITYAMGTGKLNYALAKTDRVPPEDRFVKKILDFNLNEPMELDELPGKGILFIERRGALKLYNFATEATETIAQLHLFYGNEDGLLGLAVDPNYEKNNWIYLFYSKAGDTSQQHVSRFNLVDNKLLLDSEKILLVIPTDRHCCHSGGVLEFGYNGDLFIAVGKLWAAMGFEIDIYEDNFYKANDINFAQPENERKAKFLEQLKKPTVRNSIKMNMYRKMRLNKTLQDMKQKATAIILKIGEQLKE